MKKRGLLTISPEILLALLKVEDATILDIRIDHFKAGQIEILLDSPRMPDCEAGGYPQGVNLEDIRSIPGWC